MHLVLIRHGETEANIDWRWTGWTDSPLSSQGEEQVARTAELVGYDFKGNSKVVTSPIGRAYKTAEALGNAIHVVPIVNDGLKEMYFGDLEDIPSDKFKLEHPDVYSRWSDRTDENFQWPGGESRFEFRQRVAKTITDLASQTNNDPTLVVTHSGVIKIALAHFLPERFSQWWHTDIENCSLTHLIIDESGTYSVSVLNDTTHLR